MPVFGLKTTGKEKAGEHNEYPKLFPAKEMMRICWLGSPATEAFWTQSDNYVKGLYFRNGQITRKKDVVFLVKPSLRSCEGRWKYETMSSCLVRTVSCGVTLDEIL